MCRIWTDIDKEIGVSGGVREHNRRFRGRKLWSGMELARMEQWKLQLEGPAGAGLQRIWLRGVGLFLGVGEEHLTLLSWACFCCEEEVVVSEVNGKSFHRHLMASGVSSFSKSDWRKGECWNFRLCSLLGSLSLSRVLSYLLNEFSPQ